MEKPITLVIEETKKKIIDNINESELPPFIIEPIIKDILTDVTFAKKQQYESDVATYQNSVMNDNQSTTFQPTTTD